MLVSKAVCVACGHQIDAAAKLCPYCGADPKTGQKVDTEALLRETFHLHPSSATTRVVEYARQRQGIVVALGILALLVVLAALHQFVTARNATAVSSGPAVPLSDIADLGGQANEPAQLPMPTLHFQFDGNPSSLRTYVVEPGAVTPPDVVAAQQAAAQQAAAQKAQNGARPAPHQPATSPPNNSPGTPPASRPR